MKFQTTQKAIRESYRNVICVPYADLQFLLMYSSPVAYTANVYGWRSDVYTFGNVAISTGYSPFGNIKPEHKLIRKYDEKAEKICHNRTWKYETKKRKLENLADAFIADALNE